MIPDSHFSQPGRSDMRSVGGLNFLSMLHFTNSNVVLSTLQGNKCRMLVQNSNRTKKCQQTSSHPTCV